MVPNQGNNQLSKSLERLAKLHALTHADGSINYTAFACRVGLPAPTIMRWHKGFTKDVSKRAIFSVCRALNVSEAQVRGIEPLVPARSKRQGEIVASPRDRELIEKLRSLPVRKQKDIEKFLDMKIRLVADTNV